MLFEGAESENGEVENGKENLLRARRSKSELESCTSEPEGRRTSGFRLTHQAPTRRDARHLNSRFVIQSVVIEVGVRRQAVAILLSLPRPLLC